MNRFTLVSIYGPNTDDTTFFNNVIMRIATAEGQCIIGGDFNLVLDPAQKHYFVKISNNTYSGHE